MAAQNPFLADSSGNWGAWLQPGTYKVSITASGTTGYLLTVTVPITPSGNIPFTGTVTFKNLETTRYEDQFTGATLASRITAAASDCGANPCTVIIPSSESGATMTGYPASIPDTVLLQDQRVGGYSLIANYQYCNKNAGLFNIQTGTSPVSGLPSGQAAGIPTACIGYYDFIQANNTVNQLWGEQPNVYIPPGTNAGWLAWGSEADVNVDTTNSGQGIGYDAVANTYVQTQSVAGRPLYGHRTAASFANGNPPWQVGFQCDNPGIICYSVQPPDSGQKVTQSITGSGSPQTVTTNVVPGGRLQSQAWISIDSGASQEDVNLTAVSGSPYSVTGIFTKSHANNTAFTEYSSDRLWDASLSVTRLSAYNLGSVQAYNNSNTPNVLGWTVFDSAGVQRLYDFFGSNNVRAFRDLGAGWVWQNLAGSSNLFALSSSGQFSGSALQGTDTSLLTSGTVSASTGVPLCTDANHGATTSGCNPSGVSEMALTANGQTSLTVVCQEGASGSNLCAETIFANAHTLVRLTYNLSQAPATCSPNAVIAVRDVTAGTNLTTITVNQGVAGFVDSGALSIATTAGHKILVGTNTAAAGCGTVPNANTISAVFQ